MPSIRLDGQPVEGLYLTDSMGATWIADVELAADEAPAGDVELSDGTRTMRGHVIPGSSGILAGLARVRVIGGRGGLLRPVEAKHFRSVQVREVLSDTLQSIGEALDSSAARQELSTLLAQWSRFAGPSGAAMVAVLEQVGASWRTLDNGNVWAGVPAYPESESTALVLDRFEHQGWGFCAPEGLDLVPGEFFDDREIRRVQYSIEGGHLRARYWWN
ncbi:MAG: hypothetical protein R3337_00015 [Gammaproteobacteria bacterium]|nr:hypothetical protein [Gammaproteobacteria bacterium]